MPTYTTPVPIYTTPVSTHTTSLNKTKQNATIPIGTKNIVPRPRVAIDPERLYKEQKAKDKKQKAKEELLIGVAVYALTGY